MTYIRIFTKMILTIKRGINLSASIKIIDYTINPTGNGDEHVRFSQ
jgi:hypothetical protein